MTEIFDWEAYVNYYPDLKYAGISRHDDALYHWNQYGKQEGRKIFLTGDKCIKADTVVNEEFDILQDTKSNIIVSLTTIPSRIIHPDFHTVISTLYNQKLKPKYIVINICVVYRRKTDVIAIDNVLVNLKSEFDNLIINYSEDCGPLTKIFGLLKLKSRINNDDIIIFVNDDILYHKNMTILYGLCFQLYYCEIVFVPENINTTYKNIIFNDNFQDYIDISLTFAMKYMHIAILFTFYQHNMTIDNNIWKYYNILLFLFYKNKKLYTCAINCNVHLDNQLEISKIDPFSQIVNNQLEKLAREKFLFIYDIFSKLYGNENKDESNIIMPRFINKRYLLFNTNNITYDPEDNNYHKMHIDIKYLNKNHSIVTFAHYENIKIDDFNITLVLNENKMYKLSFPHNHFSKRSSFILFFEDTISRIDHINYDFPIIQTNKNEKITLNRFFSIVSILNYLPDLEYKFFTNHDIFDYLTSIDEIYGKLLLKIIPGAYKADFFRYIYLYYNGGIYFDCKIILLTNIEYLLLKNNFVKDRYENYVYNALMIVVDKMYNILKDIIKECTENIINENHTDDCLKITGPILVGKYIKNNMLIQMHGNNDNDKYIMMIDSKKIICKANSLDYYKENNYMTTYYSDLWKRRYVFNDIPIKVENNIL